MDYERIDHISNLHDMLLCDILSFLPTKSAVRTSVLSKRWEYVWTKVPSLDFTEMPKPRDHLAMLSDKKINRFKNFVGSVLLQNDVSYLQRFCFNSDLCHKLDYDINLWNSWMDAVKLREICDLEIKLRGKPGHFLLPAEFLSGQRLKVIELDGFQVGDMRMAFHLPNLEIIRFGRDMRFTGDQFLNGCLSGCPVLKELFIHNLNGLDETLCIESLTLKSLETRNFSSKRDNSLCITIQAPNLWYLGLRDVLAHYNIGNLNLLTEANVCLREHFTYRGIDHHTFQLLKKVSRVTTLRLAISKLFSYEGELPMFENLTTLKLRDWTHVLLKHAPKLKNLTFEKTGRPYVGFYPEVAPECMSDLESVQLFACEVNVVKLVEHFLKAATSLKEMKVNFLWYDKQSGRAVHQRLLKLLSSSTICKFEVVYRNNDHRPPDVYYM